MTGPEVLIAACCLLVALGIALAVALQDGQDRLRRALAQAELERRRP